MALKGNNTKLKEKLYDAMSNIEKINDGIRNKDRKWFTKSMSIRVL